MADYKTDEEKKRDKAKADAEKMSASARIELMTKEKQAQDLKLREARKAKTELEKAATAATLAANKKSATYPSVPIAPVVGIATPLFASAAALADGRLGSKEDVVSWVTAGVGLLGAVGAVLTDNPTGALVLATLMAGGLSSTGSRRSRAWGERMHTDAAHGKVAG